MKCLVQACKRDNEEMNLPPQQSRIKRKIFVVIVAALAASAGCRQHAEEQPRVTPQGEEHVRSVVQMLPADSDMRRSLEQGERGAGIHHPLMDAMKRQGIKRAEVRLEFNVPFHIPHIWPGRPGKFTAVRTLYFDKYDRDCAQVTSPERLAALRASGLEQELQNYAREQAQNAPWFIFEHVPSASHGVSTIDLMDDEWLPRVPSFLYPSRDASEPPLLKAVTVRDQVELNRVLTAGKVSSATLDQALMVAAYSPDSCMVKSLLKAGADVNFRTDRGKTPLMYSAEDGILNNVKALLEAGARVADQSKDGETALSLARAHHHSDVVAFLERQMAMR